MQKKHFRTIKFLIVVAIVAAFVWFLVVSPMMTFHNNEKVLEDAARRYYELNKDQLPTGERVKTLSLNTLYKKSYLKEDFKTPYAKDLCSLEKSWVKVKRVNGEYQYYVYLDCGTLKSSIDHTGPQIKLKGKETMTINIGDKFDDPGISSVVDDKDGSIDPSTITVKGKVDSETPGEYEIIYTAVDSMDNKTTVTRTVKVIKTLIGIVKDDLKDVTNYTGNPTNNYVRLSNMYFRIYGYDDKDNVILVAEEDIANVGYNKLEKWLDEVYIKHFTDAAKKYLVESKFCNMKIDESDLNTTQCTSYTEKRYAYVPSVIDINRANANGVNFMKTPTISWTGNKKNSKEAYVTRVMFYANEMGKDYLLQDSSFNYGVRPKIVIKGKSLVVEGDGSKNKPYSFGEQKKASGGSNLSDCSTGEYVIIDGILWRIIDTYDDGTTKVISDDTLGDLQDRPITYSNPEQSTLLFDTKDKKNYGYYINNSASKYIDTSFFVAKEIEAPVYKDKIIYGEETKVNKYKLKIAPPNMFDMFSAQTVVRAERAHSYWLINSSTSSNRYAGAITDIGVPLNESIPQYEKFGVRAVAYAKKGTVISSGKGTYDSPYKLK